MTRSQSHERKLHKEWLRQGAYAWQHFRTFRRTWHSGIPKLPENLPRVAGPLPYIEALCFNSADSRLYRK